MKVSDFRVLMSKAQHDHQIEICGYPIDSIAVFDGKVNIDCAHLDLTAATQVIYSAAKEVSHGNNMA